MLNALVIVYLILLLLRPMEFVPALQDVPILQLLLLACMLAWVFSPRKTLRFPQFPLAMWFAVAGVLSVGFAGWWGGAIGRLVYLAPILILFVILTAAARELAMLRRIMAVMIVCSCIMVLHGRWQLSTGLGWTGLPLLEGRITYAGIFSDPNDLGQLFVICIAFCLYLYRTTRTGMRILLVAAAIWICYGIFMTDSRGTILAALPVLAIEGIRRYGKVVVGVVGAGACAVLIATTRFGQMSAGEQSANQRVESWYEGTQMFISHPIVGVGMGNYTEHWYLTAHNFIVLPMAELGLLGFVPWVGILWFTGRMLLWLVKEGHTPRSAEKTPPSVLVAEHEAALGLAGTFIGFFVSSFFLSQSYKHVLFVVVALVVARYLHAKEIFSDAPSLTVPAELPRFFAASLASIFTMWIVMKMLL